MPTEHMIEKYVNLALAEALNRAVKYKELSQKRTSSSRDRALWKALYLESSSMFNYLLRSIGQYGSSKIAIGGIDSIIFNEENIRRKNFIESLDEIDVELIIADAYKIAKLERDRIKDEERTVITDYMLKHPEIVQRITEQLNTVKQAMIIKQRGNPQKGGLVSAAMRKGYMPLAAKAIAEEQLADYQYEQNAEVITHQIKHDSEIQAAIKSLEAAQKQGATIKDLKSLLEPDQEINKPIEEKPFSEFSDSDFDDPGNL